jgi:phosphotransferase system HPr (HPr) family protein
MLVQEAMKYPCEVFLIKDNVETNAKSIMGVLSLAVTSGSKLVVRAIGDQENTVVDKLISMIESDFK